MRVFNCLCVPGAIFLYMCVLFNNNTGNDNDNIYRLVNQSYFNVNSHCHFSRKCTLCGDDDGRSLLSLLVLLF